MLINIPIEPIPLRYSDDWHNYFQGEFERLGVNQRLVVGGRTSRTVKDGQFLDVCETHIWKAQQIKYLAEMIQAGTIKDGDVLFFHDLWFPGLEALFYMRDALGLKFKIAGMLHAGTYDPHDFLSQKGMGRWGADLERSWFNEIDLIFLATNFHFKLINNCRVIDPRRFKIVGFPLPMPDGHETLCEETEKEDIVVFPHRLADEKNPAVFDTVAAKLRPAFPGWSFIKSKDVCTTKADYYQLLRRSKIAVSFAMQETWGIAMQEAVLSGCLPVVPDRLSYSEMYPPCFKFKGAMSEGLWLINNLMLMISQHNRDRLTDVTNEAERLAARLTLRAQSSAFDMVAAFRDRGWAV